MFVGDDMALEVGFAAARERLSQLALSGVLVSTSEDAYDHETASVMRIGAGGLSKLVRVQVRELTWTGMSAGLAIRWEATGPGGALFPVLDADIRFIPAGEHRSVLMMTCSCRPPFGSLGEALDRPILHRVATATVRRFVAQLAARIGSGPVTLASGGDVMTFNPARNRPSALTCSGARREAGTRTSGTSPMEESHASPRLPRSWAQGLARGTGPGDHR